MLLIFNPASNRFVYATGKLGKTLAKLPHCSINFNKKTKKYKVHTPTHNVVLPYEFTARELCKAYHNDPELYSDMIYMVLA